MRKTAVILTLSLALGMAGSLALADEPDAAYYQKQFTLWSKVIADLKEADVTEACVGDIEVIRTWISQAQAFLAAEKLEEIEPLIRKVKAQSDFVRAKVTRIAAEDAAAEAEELAKKAEAEAQRIADELTNTQAKLKELESKGI